MVAEGEIEDGEKDDDVAGDKRMVCYELGTHCFHRPSLNSE